MIDIHTHILPGLDDGAKTWDEALQMARLARQDGINTVVATPHGVELAPGYAKADIETKTAQFRQALDREGVELRVLSGIENYISPDLPMQLEAGRAFSLDSSPYFLVELPLQQYPLYTEQVLFELQVKGVVPVIAHPERNEAFQRDHSLLFRLIERGMLAQVTAASITGAFGSRVKATAEAFLRAKLVGWERAQSMVTTVPEAMLAGEPLAVTPPELPNPKRSWAFWRRDW